MNIRLRSIDSLDSALTLAPTLGRALVESYPGSLEVEGFEGFGRAFLEARFEDPLTVLLAAEAGDGPLAVAATAPLLDPVTGESRPLLAALWVAPPIRRRGVARVLVRELRRLVRTRTSQPLLARVPSGDDTLLAMAERLGLVRDAELVSAP